MAPSASHVMAQAPRRRRRCDATAAASVGAASERRCPGKRELSHRLMLPSLLQAGRWGCWRPASCCWLPFVPLSTCQAWRPSASVTTTRRARAARWEPWQEGPARCSPLPAGTERDCGPPRGSLSLPRAGTAGPSQETSFPPGSNAAPAPSPGAPGGGRGAAFPAPASFFGRCRGSFAGPSFLPYCRPCGGSGVAQRRDRALSEVCNCPAITSGSSCQPAACFVLAVHLLLQVWVFMFRFSIAVTDWTLCEQTGLSWISSALWVRRVSTSQCALGKCVFCSSVLHIQERNLLLLYVTRCTVEVLHCVVWL